MEDVHKTAGPLQFLIGYQLRRAYGVFAADFSVAVGETGMRQVLVGILSVVSENPGIGQGAVGRLLGIKRANMVPLINQLVEMELIERHADPSDRRAFSLHIAEAGKAMLADCLARIAHHEDRLLAGFSDTEKASLLDMLERIARRDAAADL